MEEKQNLFEHLRFLKDDFSNDIPSKILHGRGNFKVRRNWFQGLVANLEYGLIENFFSEELKKEIEEFIKYICGDFKNTQLTSQEDIIKADKLIDKILK